MRPRKRLPEDNKKAEDLILCFPSDLSAAGCVFSRNTNGPPSSRRAKPPIIILMDESGVKLWHALVCHHSA